MGHTENILIKVNPYLYSKVQTDFSLCNLTIEQSDLSQRFYVHDYEYHWL